MALHLLFLLGAIANVLVPQTLASANLDQSCTISVAHKEEAAWSKGRLKSSDDVLDDEADLQLLQHDVKVDRHMVATRFRVLEHPKSVCSGTRLDYVVVKDLKIPYGIEFDEKIEGNTVLRGYHVFPAMMNCLLDPKCGGFTRSSDGLVALWHDSAAFSVSTRDDLVGFHCYQKQSMDEVTISLSDADNYISVGNFQDAVDPITKEGMSAINAAYDASCKADDAFQKKRDYVKLMQWLNNDFGLDWAAPVTLYLTKDAAYADAAYAKQRLEEFTRSCKSLVAEFENALKMSCF